MIRLAHLSDATSIAQVHVQSWHETYQGMLNQSVLDAQSVQDRTELWRKVLVLPQHRVWVYENQGIICGFMDLDLFSDRNYAEIKAIYILLHHHQQGIGKQLMQRAFKSCQENDIHILRLEVFDQNPSRYFYEKLGASKMDEEDCSNYAEGLKIFHYQWEL